MTMVSFLRAVPRSRRGIKKPRLSKRGLEVMELGTDGEDTTSAPTRLRRNRDRGYYSDGGGRAAFEQRC